MSFNKHLRECGLTKKEFNRKLNKYVENLLSPKGNRESLIKHPTKKSLLKWFNKMYIKPGATRIYKSSFCRALERKFSDYVNYSTVKRGKLLEELLEYNGFGFVALRDKFGAYLKVGE